MGTFLLRRFATSIVTIIAIITIAFILFRLLPGDPAAVMLSPLLPAEMRQQVKASFGLDKPMHEQYLRYVTNLLRLNFGRSFLQQRPVIDVIKGRLANTLILAAAAFVLTYGLAILLSLIMTAKRGTWIESALVSICLVLRAPPVFWTGMLSIMVFSFYLGWFPYAGIRSFGSKETGIWVYLNVDFLHHLILPTLVMTAYFISFPTLLLRNAMLRHLPADYVRTARSKGLRESTVTIKHVLRNALLPVVTSAATHIGLAVAGMSVLEYVFSWPGLGRAIIEGIKMRDYPVTQGAFLLIGVMIVIMNIIADLTYATLDPRITYD